MGQESDVADVIAIQKLYADYNHLVDAGEVDAWVALFTEDGVFDPGLLPTISGAAALAEFAAALPALIPGGRHHVSNLSISVDGDTATARSYLMLWLTNADPSKTVLMSTGIYEDELVRTPAGWRLRRRVMHPDGAGS
jgi:ketosteroid isomerase-like protein